MHLLIFDSGVGGLSVAREVMAALPRAGITYVADTAVFPYGRLQPSDLIDRVITLMDLMLPASSPDAVVIACYTASTLVMPPLRARFTMPIVGTAPAVKPAAASSQSRMVSILATPGTVKRDYTRDLIRDHGQDCRFTLVGSENLATLVQRSFSGEQIGGEAFRKEIAPCFVETEEGRTDTVVLACTHYPLVQDRLEAVAPWPVTWIDPSAAIARRVVSVTADLVPSENFASLRRFIVTGEAPDPAFLQRFGFPAAEKIVL